MIASNDTRLYPYCAIPVLNILQQGTSLRLSGPVNWRFCTLGSIYSQDSRGTGCLTLRCAFQLYMRFCARVDFKASPQPNVQIINWKKIFIPIGTEEIWDNAEVNFCIHIHSNSFCIVVHSFWHKRSIRWFYQTCVTKLLWDNCRLSPIKYQHSLKWYFVMMVCMNTTFHEGVRTYWMHILWWHGNVFPFTGP